MQEEEHDDGLRGVRLAGVAQIGSRVDVREQTGDVERFLHHVHFAFRKSGRGLYWYVCVSGPTSRSTFKFHLRFSRCNVTVFRVRVGLEYDVPRGIPFFSVIHLTALHPRYLPSALWSRPTCGGPLLAVL